MEAENLDLPPPPPPKIKKIRGIFFWGPFWSFPPLTRLFLAGFSPFTFFHPNPKIFRSKTLPAGKGLLPPSNKAKVHGFFFFKRLGAPFGFETAFGFFLKTPFATTEMFFLGFLSKKWVLERF